MLDPGLTAYIIEVGAGLSVGAISAGLGYFYRGRKERKRIAEAPYIYVNRLGELIDRAVKDGEAQAPINARAIVATRNSLAGSLVSISASLNSQIDRLAEEIGESRLIRGRLEESSRPDSINAKRAYETIQVLAKIWPARREQIVIEVRKVLAELGLHFDVTREDRFAESTQRKQ